jgi:hypothetical protein
MSYFTSSILRTHGMEGRIVGTDMISRQESEALTYNKICLGVPQGEEGVVTVEPFVVLEDRQGDRLAAYLRKHLPLSELCEDEDLVHFLLSASSNEACLVENQGVVNYRIPYRVRYICQRISIHSERQMGYRFTANVLTTAFRTG